MKSLFKTENADFSDNDHKINVQNGIYCFPIEVTFLQIKEHGYGIKFMSEPLGYKPDEIEAHQKLCYTIMAKIQGEKQGFWLINKNEIPIQKAKMLKQKKHQPTWNKASVLLAEISKEAESHYNQTK